MLIILATGTIAGNEVFPLAAANATDTLIIQLDQGLTSICSFMQSATKNLSVIIFELVDTQTSKFLHRKPPRGSRLCPLSSGYYSSEDASGFHAGASANHFDVRK